MNENYKLLGSAAAQQTLMKVAEAFESFFGLLKTEGQKPRIPHYLEKDGFFELSYPQFKIQADGSFNIPMSPKFKREYGLVNIKFPTNLNPKDISEIRILPKYNATYFEIEYVYQIKETKPKFDKKHALSIDFGVNNLATCVTTIGTSFIIDGKKLKSVNQWYNKENSRLQSIKDKQGIKVLTNRQVRLLEYRNNFIRDYLNKTTRYIINYCLENNIGKIIVGHNKQWKKNIDIGKVNNQKFVQIPHSQLMKKLESMSDRYGILFVQQEESYSSQASFLDKDPIPVYDKNDKQKYIFSGKRVARGLYKIKNGQTVNADSNGSGNIMRKSGHKHHLQKIAEAILSFPKRVDLFALNKKVNTNAHLQKCVGGF